MLSIVLSVLLLASPQESTFKKERAQLQEAVDTLPGHRSCIDPELPTLRDTESL